MSNLNEGFWKQYYKNTTHNINKSSSFAEFVYDKYIADLNNNKNISLRIADLGSGNCRDSNFFASKGNIAYAIDINGENATNIPNCIKIVEDAEPVLQNYNIHSLVDIVYMRWFLHAMPYEKAESIFKMSLHNLKPNGLICIEVRSINDEELKKNSVYNEDDKSYTTTHKRWLYSKDKCIELATRYNCDIVSYEEDYFSFNDNTETSNPLLIRLVLRKKLLPYYENSENYNIYKHITTSMKERSLLSYEHLTKMDAILEKHNIKYFAVAGTLLGLTRHGGIIPWDDDIDIGFVESEWEKLKNIKDELIECGLKIHIPPIDHAAYDNQLHFGEIDCFKLTMKRDYLVGVAGVLCHKDDYKNMTKQIFGYTYIWAPTHCTRTLSYRYKHNYFFQGDVNDNHHFKDTKVPRFTLNEFDRSFQTM